MRPTRRIFRQIAMLALVVAATGSLAQAQPAKDYEPQVGQAGKDVIWVPTPQALVDRMLDTAKVTASDYVVDLGSGDGRTVITAAKRGAKALGIEYNPDMVELSKRNAAAAGVGDKATFMKADIFETDFSQATVVTLFLLSSLNLKLRPIILDMKAGTRVASNTFDMGEWQADEIIDASPECTSYCRGFFWVVPTKVAGSWKLAEGLLTLEQRYQMLSGTLKAGNVIAPVNGRLRGEEITFSAGGTEYAGRVSGKTMAGTSRAGSSEGKWEAARQ